MSIKDKLGYISLLTYDVRLPLSYCPTSFLIASYLGLSDFNLPSIVSRTSPSLIVRHKSDTIELKWSDLGHKIRACTLIVLHRMFYAQAAL